MADFCFNNSIPAAVMDIVNPLTPGTFYKKCGFFGHFGAFQAGSWQISFNPVENAFATQQLAYCVLPHCDLGMRRNQTDFEKVTYVFRLFHFWNFFRLPFFSFSFLFAAVIDLLLGLVAVKKLLRKGHRDGQISFSSPEPTILLACGRNREALGATISGMRHR